MFAIIYGILLFRGMVRVCISGSTVGTMIPPHFRPSLARVCFPFGFAATIGLVSLNMEGWTISNPWIVFSPFWVCFLVSHEMLLISGTKRQLESNAVRILMVSLVCTTILMAINLDDPAEDSLIIPWFVVFAPFWASGFCLALAYALSEVGSSMTEDAVDLIFGFFCVFICSVV